jgi:hypothetical protein
LNAVPAGTTLDINLKSGQHVVSKNNVISSAICIGNCTPPAGATTQPKTGNGTVHNNSTGTTTPVVNTKSPTPAPVVHHAPAKSIKTVTTTTIVKPTPSSPPVKHTTTTVTKPDPTSPTQTKTTSTTTVTPAAPTVKAGTTTTTKVEPVNAPVDTTPYLETEIVTYNGYM